MTDMATSSRLLLRVDHLWVGYGHVGVLEDVSMVISAGAIVALVGANGAGKTTLLRAISGLLRPLRGEVVFDGNQIGGRSPDRIVADGVLHVAEGRRLFRSQSVFDNLELGLYGARLGRKEEKLRLEAVLDMFPVLRDRLRSRADLLSGGQQQMLAIGQALMRQPRLLMLDEPSLGLAPIVVDQLLDVLVKLRERGTTILLVEQMVERALEIADYNYIMQNGRMIGEGRTEEVHKTDLLQRAYLGLT